MVWVVLWCWYWLLCVLCYCCRFVVLVLEIGLIYNKFFFVHLIFFVFMRLTDVLSNKVYSDLFNEFVGLRDVEGSVGKAMRKYGEDREMEGMIVDDMSFDDEMSIRMAGDEEESDYWEGLKRNGGGVIGVCEYLDERFGVVYRGEGNEEAYVSMLEWVLGEARRFEGEIGA